MIDFDHMLGELLDHYSQLNVAGKITEEEMERRMDKARLLSKEQIKKLYQRLRRKPHTSC